MKCTNTWVIGTNTNPMNLEFTDFRCVHISVRPSVCPSVHHTFFSMSRLWEKVVGNDWENSLNASNSSKSLPNCPKMSQNVPKCLKMPTSDASLSERTCLSIFYDQNDAFGH